MALTNLFQTLDLSFNLLSEFSPSPSVRTAMPALVWLSLAGNSLTEVPRAISDADGAGGGEGEGKDLCAISQKIIEKKMRLFYQHF